MRRPENVPAAAIPWDDQGKTTPNAGASGDRAVSPGLLQDSKPSTVRRETQVPPKRPRRRRKKGAAAAGPPQARGAGSTLAFGGKGPELGTQAESVSACGDKARGFGTPGGGGGGGGRGGGGGVLSGEQEASCGSLAKGGSSPGKKGAGGREGRTDEAESGAFGKWEADEVDVYAVLDFEATCEDRSIDGGR